MEWIGMWICKCCMSICMCVFMCVEIVRVYSCDPYNVLTSLFELHYQMVAITLYFVNYFLSSINPIIAVSYSMLINPISNTSCAIRASLANICRKKIRTNIHIHTHLLSIKSFLSYKIQFETQLIIYKLTVARSTN